MQCVPLHQALYQASSVRRRWQMPEMQMYGVHSDSLRQSSPSSAETANRCVILSSSRNADNISSDRTTNLLPLSRCASTIQSVRPSESTAETQPKLQPALPSLSAIISQSLIQSPQFL